MFTSNYTKLFLLMIAVAIFSASCRFFQVETSENDSTQSIDEPGQASPFQTKDPEIFQTEITVTTFVDGASGEKSERKYFVAKERLASYTAFNFGSENETALIETSAGKQFVLNKKDKTYREKGAGDSAGKRSELQKFLTTKWLNEKRDAKFEKLGSENGTEKFRVIIDDSKSSEAIIYIDEKLSVPVKQEFYSVSNDKRELKYSVEMSNFKRDVPTTLFEIPEDYRPSKPQ